MCNPRLTHIWLLGCLVSVLATSTALAQRAAAPGTDNKSPSQSQTKSDHSDLAYLGVEVESLHPSLSSHLPSNVANGQGVLVTYVSPDSPAEKAGLKEHDVLTTYDDQKLYAPEQLAKLVQADKPQREVTLGIVRGGKSQQLKVTLGTQPYEAEPQAAWESPMPGAWPWGFPERPIFRRLQRRNADAGWESFDSMTLRKVGDHKFRVEIQYLDKNGKKEQHAFEGTRDQIRRDIEAERDLPADERFHLLSSLGIINEPFDRSAQFPAWNYGPWGRPY